MRALTMGGRRVNSSSLQILRQFQHNHNKKNGPSAFHLFHTHVGSPWDDQSRKKREEDRARQQLSSLSAMSVAEYHTTAPVEKGVALVLGLGALSAASYAGASAVTAWKEYKASLPSEEELEEQRKQREQEGTSQKKQEQAQASSKNTENEGKRENIFHKLFGVGVGAKYYEGGFEEQMTRREAALILGVRESSSPARIKEAHRKLLVMNHPDTGGSTYVAGKINEAKELLLKGKRGM